MIQSKSQLMAQAAYAVACDKDFQGVAREFPTLVHSCGLAQAFVFARAKERINYRKALTRVLAASGWEGCVSDDALEQKILTTSALEYIRLSRDALMAAEWIKRYAEVDAKEDNPNA